MLFSFISGVPGNIVPPVRGTELKAERGREVLKCPGLPEFLQVSYLGVNLDHSNQSLGISVTVGKERKVNRCGRRRGEEKGKGKWRGRGREKEISLKRIFILH